MKSMRYSVAAVAMVAVLAACSSSPAGSQNEGSQDAGAADADVTVTAVNIAFDETTLTAPAGEAFTLALINEDAAQHNVAIYTDSSLSESLFVGEFIGEGTIVYDVPALEPGEYFFRCDLHPEMQGTLVVEG
jgi:plastocyanin